MATVTGLTADRMLEIEAASVVDGEVVGDNLILTTRGQEQIDAGNVRGPTGHGVPAGGTAGQCLVKINATDYNTQWGTRLTQANGDARYIKLTGSQIERGSTPPNIAAVPGTIYLQLATGTDLGTLWVKETGTDTSGWKPLSTFGISNLASGQDLNSVTTPGYYRIDTSAIANTLINWPVEAVPRADKADSNNLVGSFRPALTGFLTVTNTSLLIQTVEIMWPGFAAYKYSPGGPLVFTYKRTRLSDGVTWGPWEYLTPGSLHVLSSSEKNTVSKEVFYGSMSSKARTPARLLVDSVSTGPTYLMEDVSPDGVQWYRPSNNSRLPMSGWTVLTLQNGFDLFSPTGTPWPGLSAIRTSAGIVCIRGLLKRVPNPTAGMVIANLPQGMRPAGKLEFVGCADNNTTGSTISVEPNGDIKFQTAGSVTTTFVDLNMIMFPAADVAPNSAWTTVATIGNWNDVGLTDTSWPRLSYWQDQHGRVWLRGMLQYNGNVPAGSLDLFILPAPFSPAYQIQTIMPMSNTTKKIATMRFTPVTPATPETSDCKFFYSANPTGSPFMFAVNQTYVFPVASIPESSWRNLTFANGWANYVVGTSFPPASVWSAPDGIQHIRGLIKGGTAPPVVPIGNWGVGDKCDAYSLLSSVVTQDLYGRIDLTQTNINIVSGQIAWLSLDGIHYMLEA